MIPWKLAEAAFGRFWLLLIPIIIAPIVAMAMVVHEPAYYSQANVWVARPDNVDPGDLLQTNNYWETPAQTQATVIRDLLGTRSFRREIALAAGMSEGGAGRVWSEVGVAAVGTNIMAITATSPNPDDSAALVMAVIDAYSSRAAQAATDDVQFQVNYIEAQLETANGELATRQAALDAYLVAHPTADDPSRPERDYQQLVTRVDTQLLLVNGLTDALLNIQRTAAAAPQAFAATFRVEDPASSPQLIGESVTKRYGYPLIAIVFGAAISATYLYVMFRIDHAIRTSQDLVDLPVPVLGFVPQVKGGKPRWLALPPFKWLSLGNNRDYARHVAASMSTTTPAPEGS